jgi:hypothetical protein
VVAEFARIQTVFASCDRDPKTPCEIGDVDRLVASKSLLHLGLDSDM